MVLVYEAELSAEDVRRWITAYNRKCEIQLTLFEELPNALYVIQLDADR